MLRYINNHFFHKVHTQKPRIIAIEITITRYFVNFSSLIIQLNLN